MPKVKIREVDNTGTTTLGEIPNVVYIPGSANKHVDPKLFRSASAFKKAFEDEANDYVNDLSAKMAHHLLKLGMQVLYEGFPLTAASEATITSNAFTIDGVAYTIADNTITWTEGSTEKSSTINDLDVATLKDGLMVKVEPTKVSYPVRVESGSVVIKDSKFTIGDIEYTIGSNTVTWSGGSANVVNGVVELVGGVVATLDFVHNIVNYEVVVSAVDSITISSDTWKALEDKARFDVRFLTTGGYWLPSTDMITCAAKRVDAIALLDTKSLEVADVRSELSPIILASKSTALDSTDDATSFAAVFVPTLTMEVIGLDDKTTVEEVPASFGYLCAFATSVQENPIWYAAAGSFRGIIPNLVDVKKEYSTAEIEMLQSRASDQEVVLDGDGDNVGIAFNPIAYVRPFGHIVWGNRTTRDNPEGEDGTGVVKATSFLNCRVLSTEVAKTAYNAARKYTFEQNSEVLWLNYTSQILPLLDRMATGNGILDYSIKRVASDKKARLAARIALIPIEAAEDFDINIELTDSISISE